MKAVKAIKKTKGAKFDETVEVAMRLGVDPRHSDQQVRGTVVLPHGTGKKVRILVLCRGDKEAEARDAGADHVGFEDYIKQMQDGWLDIDAIIATPDVMGEVGKLGRFLGPRGLMPNPKTGTVTFDVGKAVRDIQGGKIDFRVDKGANVQAPVGKLSFEEDALLANANAFVREIHSVQAVRGQRDLHQERHVEYDDGTGRESRHRCPDRPVQGLGPVD